MDVRRPTLNSITAALLDHVTGDARGDLRSEDPKTAIELYYGPIGFQPLASSKVTAGHCSIDGCYEIEVDPERPWIIYANDVNERRVRFTLMHELGHHLIGTVAAHLVDDLDQLGSSSDEAIQLEEAVCHRFAGHLLVPEDLLQEVLGNGPVVPSMVQELHERCEASWEAIAVRVTESMTGFGAVVILRESDRVSFCAASSRFGYSWWPRNSLVNPNGPLFRGLRLQQTALPDTYRFGMAYAKAMFCDTLPIHGGLTIAVLSEKPSDGSLSIIEEAEPSWKEKTEFCEWHPGIEREVGWCFKCKGKRCPECFRCGCKHPVNNPLCPGCGLINPFRSGATICRDCEADLN